MNIWRPKKNLDFREKDSAGILRGRDDGWGGSKGAGNEYPGTAKVDPVLYRQRQKLF